MRGNRWPGRGGWSTCPALGGMSCDLAEVGLWDLTMSASSPTPNTCQIWSTTTSPPNFSFPASRGPTLCKAHSYLLIGVGQFLVFTWSVKDATILEWAKQHPDYPSEWPWQGWETGAPGTHPLRSRHSGIQLGIGSCYCFLYNRHRWSWSKYYLSYHTTNDGKEPCRGQILWAYCICLQGDARVEILKCPHQKNK